MSTDQLRDAADKLRALAAQIPIQPDNYRTEWTDTYQNNDSLVREDGDYIATMHPGVALALAAWLDQTAHTLDMAAEHMPRLQPDLTHMTAVAQAILGDDT